MKNSKYFWQKMSKNLNAIKKSQLKNPSLDFVKTAADLWFQQM